MSSVCVVGSINVDFLISTDKFPTIGETILGKELTIAHGGKGANQAVQLARLNTKTMFFGVVGGDANGVEYLSYLKKEGIDVSNVLIKDGVMTGTAHITISNGDNSIIAVPGANSFVDIDYIKSVEKEILKSSILLIQREIPIESIIYLIELAYKNGIKIVFNPAPALSLSEDIIKKISYLPPNEHEVLQLFSNKFSIEEILDKYREKIFVTIGDKGVMYSDKNGDIKYSKPFKTEVIDSSGAGDSFNGAFVSRLVLGETLESSLKFANAAASLSIKKLGAQTGMPTEEEVYELVNE